MRSAFWLLAVLLVLSVLLIGCGGGGGPARPPAQNGSNVLGRIAGVSDASAYQILVDGRPVDVTPNAAGEFTIPGVPPGMHTIGVVAPDGMVGGWAKVRIGGTGRPVTVGDITPGPAGKIGGSVREALPDGNTEAVPGVTVTATSSQVWIMDGGGSATDPVVIGGDGETISYSATTAEDGFYEMAGVSPGGYDVSVTVPGFDPQVLYVWVEPGQLVAANFVVYPAPEQGVGTVKGIVTGEGEPLEAAQITVVTGQPWIVPLPEPVARALAAAHLEAGLSVPGSSGGGNGSIAPPWIEVRQFTTLSDHLGHYSLNVPIGTHSIECWLEGWEWQGDQIVIEKDQTTIKGFELQRWTEPPPPDPGGPDDPTDPGTGNR